MPYPGYNSTTQRYMGPKQLGLALEEVGFGHLGEVKTGLAAHPAILLPSFSLERA